jgi:hypothetical protein
MSAAQSLLKLRRQTTWLLFLPRCRYSNRKAQGTAVEDECEEFLCYGQIIDRYARKQIKVKRHQTYAQTQFLSFDEMRLSILRCPRSADASFSVDIEGMRSRQSTSARTETKRNEGCAVPQLAPLQKATKDSATVRGSRDNL